MWTSIHSEGRKMKTALTEAEIDNIIEVHETVIYAIADRFNVAPIGVMQIAEWILEGKPKGKILGDLDMEIPVAQEYPDCGGERQREVRESAEEIMAALEQQGIEQW